LNSAEAAEAGRCWCVVSRRSGMLHTTEVLEAFEVGESFASRRRST
jgi:hypothetical protein